MDVSLVMGLEQCLVLLWKRSGIDFQERLFRNQLVFRFDTAVSENPPQEECAGPQVIFVLIMQT